MDEKRRLSERLHHQDLSFDPGASRPRASLTWTSSFFEPPFSRPWSLPRLENLGPAVHKGCKEFNARRDNKPAALAIDLPQGGMRPVGNVVIQHELRMDRVVKAYEKWLNRIPATYLESILQNQPTVESAELAKLNLKPADGAIGAHYRAVREVDGSLPPADP